MSMWFAENLGVSNEKRCKRGSGNIFCYTFSKSIYIYKVYEITPTEKKNETNFL